MKNSVLVKFVGGSNGRGGGEVAFKISQSHIVKSNGGFHYLLYYNMVRPPVL